MTDTGVFAAEARVLGLLVATNWVPFPSLFTDISLTEKVLDKMERLYESAVLTSSKDCVHDIFWTLGNLAAEADSTTLELIFDHTFWHKQVICIEVDTLGNSSVVTELCHAVICVLLPLCEEGFAYGL